MCPFRLNDFEQKSALVLPSITADYCKRHTYPCTKDYVAAQQIPPSMAWGSQTIKSASIAPIASDVADATAAAASRSDSPPLRSSACSKAKCWDVIGCARTR